MKRIALINFYFADKIPDYMDFYLASVANNISIDLFLFTNLNIISNYTNIRIVKMELSEFINIIENSVSNELKRRGIDDEVKIKSAYKIADFRPTFGLCFQEYIKDYDFWGGCDLDIVFGNIRKYIPDSVLDHYDKIFEHGHFFLIRNSQECNTAFLEDYENCFKGVLKLDKNSFFEEVYEKPWLPHGGINSIFEKKGALYKNRKCICDISFKFHNLIDLKNPSLSKQNVFSLDKGRLYRHTYFKGKVVSQEIFYAHFQKRLLKVHTKDVFKYIIGNDAFEKYELITKSTFRYTSKFNIITKRYIKFRYLDAVSRKIHGDFKWRDNK